MAREINPKDTKRSNTFKLWMKAPNPMVTFFKTLNITNLVKISRKRNYKFNMFLDYCIGRAAESIKEFFILPLYGVEFFNIPFYQLIFTEYLPYKILTNFFSCAIITLGV